MALLVGWPRPAAAQHSREAILFVGLRPTTDDHYGDTEIRFLAEAQRLREVAGSVVRMIVHRPVINHTTLREQLGSEYLVDFVECRGDVGCVSKIVGKLAERTRLAVYGDYTVDRDVYKFRIRLIDVRKAAVVREVEFKLGKSDKEDRKLWRRELEPLLAGEDVSGGGGGGGGGESGEGQGADTSGGDNGGLPELAPINPDGDGGGDSSGGGGGDQTQGGDGGGDGGGSAFVDDSALEAISRGIAWHGHFQNYAAVGTRGAFRRDLLIFDNRLQLEFESTISPIRVVGKPQLVFDGLNNEFHLRFREVYATRDYEKADFSVGERILTWGLTDFWPVVDILNPRNFSQIENWRPIDEKLPIPLLRTSAVFGPFTLRLVALPILESSEYQLDPTEPFALASVPPLPGVTIREQPLPASLDNSGGGGVLDMGVSNWKLSLYGLVGRNPLPTIYSQTDQDTMETTFTIENERVAMGAASLQGSIDSIGTIFRAEAAGYYRMDDRCAGMDADVGGVPQCFYLHRVPTARATVSLEKRIVHGLDAHLQYISEYTRSKDIPRLPAPVAQAGVPEQPKYNPILTLRLQGEYLHDDFRPMVFAYWSLADQDFLVNADFEYHVADGFAVAVGGFWFQGYAADENKNHYTFAGSLAPSSNAYLRATAFF